KLGEILQRLQVSRGDRRAGLDLDADAAAGRVLQEEVDLLPRQSAVVEESGLDRAPGRLLAELHQDEVLEQQTGELGLLRQARGVESEGVGEQAGVAEQDLRRPGEPFAQVRGPGRQSLNKEGGFEERKVALQGALRQTAAPGELREIEERPGAGGEQREEPRE